MCAPRLGTGKGSSPDIFAGAFHPKSRVLATSRDGQRSSDRPFCYLQLVAATRRCFRTTDDFIRTDDDALLLFHLDGRTIWSEDGSHGGQSLRVSFASDDDRFRWMNDALCVLEGVVDTERIVMSAKIYVCHNELLEDGPAAR